MAKSYPLYGSFSRIFDQIQAEELNKRYEDIFQHFLHSSIKGAFTLPIDHVDKNVTSLNIEVSAPKFKLGDTVQLITNPAVVFVVDEVKTEVAFIMRSADNQPRTSLTALHKYAGLIIPQFRNRVEGYKAEADLRIYDPQWDKKPVATVTLNK